MNFVKHYEGLCRGKECQASNAPKNIKDSFPLAKLNYRCNRCWRLEFGPDQRGPSVQNLIKETGELPTRPVRLDTPFKLKGSDIDEPTLP